MPIVNKVLQDTLKIDDPITFIVSNKDNKEIMAQLSHKFVGKCYMSSLILKIVRVIRRSAFIVNQNGINDQYSNPVFGTTDVEFEVEALTYRPGEIITGAIVRNNDEYNNIYCDTKYAAIYLKENKLYESLQVGQIISVTVQHIMYEVWHEKISIGAELFVPRPFRIAYEVSDMSLSLAPQIPEDTDEVTKARESFIKLISPYKVAPKQPSPIINVFSLCRPSDIAAATKIPRYLVRDSRLDPASPIVWGTDNAADIETDEIICGLTLDSIIIAIIEHYKNYNNLIQGMVEHYNTAEIIKKHDNLWRIYGKVKV